MRQELEFQADRIEAVLTLHKVVARVTGGTVTPRWVRFQVLPAVGTRISRIKGLSEELAAALDTSSCRVSRRGAAVTVEVERDDPQPVRLLPLYRQLTGPPRGAGVADVVRPSVPPVTAVLGLAEDGTPLLVRLPSPDVAHILVAGTTGSGKTVLLQTMILTLAMTNPASSAPPLCQENGRGGGLALVLVDPKGCTFGRFEGLPHLARPVIWETEETAEALHSLVRLMERRPTSRCPPLNPSPAPLQEGRRRREEEGPQRWRQPHVVVVIDELADLLMTGGKAVQWALTRLTQRGRGSGIHIVAATQKPTAAVLGPLIKANFPVRLVGRVTSIEDARTATGWSGTGAERLMGRGDFLAVAEGRVTRFQAAHVSPEEIREVVMGIENGEWRMEGRQGGVLSADSSSLAASGRVSLPWPVRRLTETLRGV